MFLIFRDLVGFLWSGRLSHAGKSKRKGSRREREKIEKMLVLRSKKGRGRTTAAKVNRSYCQAIFVWAHELIRTSNSSVCMCV